MPNNPKNQFETMLFLPVGENRKGVGGLRTKGEIKKSYDDKPLISIITSVYNGEEFLEETILSVINQSYDNVEYIIIDGGSTDGTLDILKKYEDKLDYWVSEGDTGIYDAWNKGIKVSSGDWIAFLGSDDFYLEDAIQSYVTFISNLGRKVDYVSSKVEVISKDKRKIAEIAEGWNWRTFKTHMSVAHVGSLHHRDFFRVNGLYDTSYKIAGDYEMLLRKKQNLSTGYMEKFTANVRDGGISHTTSMYLLKVKESMKAKINTGHRNIFIARTEYYVLYLRRFVKQKLGIKATNRMKLFYNYTIKTVKLPKKTGH